ncbi:hypothetical protein AbraIFM66951_002874 [Aspergillus brasiliensis]|uniref:Uncharacterized protein n=1 Tax=Aspergillus brasiliensis TaxID=319629 RepID=A0A9W5YKM1_9EURO|nr:hypothetical protein AbraCBS73388_004411 [Aspergillus brasiliensis]GKZ50027.1 hypothetical protein AbraIFM66951_002874 [Aspergillus brasiliensis]
MAAMDCTTTLQTIEIELNQDEGSGGFHTKNNPQQPFQRSKIHQHRGGVDIKCSLVDVAHGKWSPHSNDYASLIVLEFRFDPGKPGRRTIASTITVVFAGQSVSDLGLSVADLSFNDNCSLGPTMQEEVTTNAINGSLGVGGLSYAQIAVEGKRERVVSRKTADATYVTGSACAIGLDGDSDNAVEWKLMENKTLRTGVPVYFRAGIILRRETLANFQCTVEIDTRVDVRSTMERWFGRQPVDDPVLFNPTLKATSQIMDYDLENLGGTDLTRVGEVRFSTVLG